MKNYFYLPFLTFLVVMTTACQTTKKTEAQVSQAEALEAEQKASPQKRLIHYWECVRGEEKRIIERRNASEGGCEVYYGPDGMEEEVASARWDVAHCDQVLLNIKKNLEAAGFSCEA